MDPGNQYQHSSHEHHDPEEVNPAAAKKYRPFDQAQTYQEQ